MNYDFIIFVNVYPESLACHVVFVFERVVDKMCTGWDEFDSFELWADGPELVVYSELHFSWDVEEKEEAKFFNVLIRE